jgi:hypothetical protein
MTAIRANIVGPLRATNIRASIATCHCASFDSCSGRAVM